MRPRPKTGDKRATRQPLSIDRLPVEMQDRIRAERRKGRPWAEIEQQSPTWKEWKDVGAELLPLFPGRKLPHSNLARWYDIRIEQAMAEAQKDNEAARQIAASLAGRGFEGLPEAVRTALGEQVFALLRAGGDRSKLVKALSDFGWVLAELSKVELAKEKLQLDKERVDISRQKLDAVKAKLGTLRKDVEKKQLSPAQLQQRLDELYGIA